MTGREAKARIKKQYDRQNEHIKEKYDRVSITLTKGTKARMAAAGEKSINKYISRLVLDDLERRENAGRFPEYDDDLPEFMRK